MPDVLVAGIGNLDRGDDGAGLLVARQVRRQASPGVGVVELEGPMSLVDALETADHVIVIDVASSGGVPGTVSRIDAHGDAIPVRQTPGSSHGLGVAESIELARTLGRLPRQLILYVIEGSSFDLGTAPTRAVQAGVVAATAAILAEIREAG